MRSFLQALLVVLMTLSYSTTGFGAGDKFVPTEKPGADEALVYFYRPDALQLWNLSFYADGNKICDLHRSERYTHVTVPAGNYMITSHPTFRRGGPPKLEKSNKANVDLEIGVDLLPGETYFIEYRYEQKRAGLGKSEVNISLRSLNESEAISEISKCSYVRPEAQRLVTTGPFAGKSKSQSSSSGPKPPSAANLRYVVQNPIYLHLRY